MTVPTRAVVTALAVLMLACGSSEPAPTATPTSPGPARDPGNVNCLEGQPAHPGLARFGALIGTWQSAHHQNPKATADYTTEAFLGHINIRCSTDNHVIVEQLHLASPRSADEAVQVALAELPDDAVQVYDHTHPACRTLQFQSQQLAQQLDGNDSDGRVGVELESESAAYTPDQITLVLIDLLDNLNEDTQGC